ncbi:hypothetical protein C8R45DRAFT_948363 [Mycena sanguinolenta]|nr:hypothetical protein C8R45DRAFT_948363 [Mycena sanguinolenta]
MSPKKIKYKQLFRGQYAVFSPNVPEIYMRDYVSAEPELCSLKFNSSARWWNGSFRIVTRTFLYDCIAQGQRLCEEIFSLGIDVSDGYKVVPTSLVCEWTGSILPVPIQDEEMTPVSKSPRRRSVANERPNGSKSDRKLHKTGLLTPAPSIDSKGPPKKRGRTSSVSSTSSTYYLGGFFEWRSNPLQALGVWTVQMRKLVKKFLYPSRSLLSADEKSAPEKVTGRESNRGKMKANRGKRTKRRAKDDSFQPAPSPIRTGSKQRKRRANEGRQKIKSKRHTLFLAARMIPANDIPPRPLPRAPTHSRTAYAFSTLLGPAIPYPYPYSSRTRAHPQTPCRRTPTPEPKEDEERRRGRAHANPHSRVHARQHAHPGGAAPEAATGSRQISDKATGVGGGGDSAVGERTGREWAMPVVVVVDGAAGRDRVVDGGNGAGDRGDKGLGVGGGGDNRATGGNAGRWAVGGRRRLSCWKSDVTFDPECKGKQTRRTVLNGMPRTQVVAGCRPMRRGNRRQGDALSLSPRMAGQHGSVGRTPEVAKSDSGDKALGPGCRVTGAGVVASRLATTPTGGQLLSPA